MTSSLASCAGPAWPSLRRKKRRALARDGLLLGWALHGLCGLAACAEREGRERAGPARAQLARAAAYFIFFVRKAFSFFKIKTFVLLVHKSKWIQTKSYSFVNLHSLF